MIRLLLLVAAVAAGGALMKTIHSKSEPLSVDDAVSAAKPTLETTTSAVDHATKAADVVVSTAQKGVEATNAAVGYINDTAQSVARKLDEMNRPTRPSADRAPLAPRAAGQHAHLPPTRGDTSRIVPLEQVMDTQDVRN